MIKALLPHKALKAFNLALALALAITMVPAQALATSGTADQHADLQESYRYSEVKELAASGEAQAQASSAAAVAAANAAANADAASNASTSSTATGASNPANAAAPSAADTPAGVERIDNPANAAATDAAAGAPSQLQQDAPLVTTTDAYLESQNTNIADTADVEMIRAGVTMNGSATTIKAVGGLVFSLDAASGTAALVGISDAPAGELTIPQTIAVATPDATGAANAADATEYTITNICPLGGGVCRF